ncbi:MAG: hypothetical protein U1F29_05390 [Planctomycetota bacterium]
MPRALQSVFLPLAPLVLGAAARAQAGCGQPGVDLAIELSAPLNATATGGVDALAFAFQPVNLGTAPASWVTTTAQHPVIGLGLARFRVVNGASRMEQVGMSWVRHVTIPALSQGSFCTCTPSAGATLGPGCNDTLSATGNTLAANLGPRHEVEPHTGQHVHPHTPAAIGPFPGQLRFAPADVTTGAGERYVVEAHLVAQDDAASGAVMNDATWCELAAGGTPSDPAFALVGSTRRGATVLDAWKEFDPAVQLLDWDSVVDGRVQVAWCVTQTGPSTWHYEYALYARDYAPGVRLFGLSTPPTAAVTNLAFHDVAYHGGDGVNGVTQSGADWSASITSGFLAWETATFAQNPNANALRWGTTYAFRFDCDRPPMPGYVQLEAFEPPSGPSGVALQAEIPLDVDALAHGYCLGDGLGAPCPCSNTSPVGHGEGCTNSMGVGGFLRVDGWSSFAHESAALVATQLPNSTALFLQGTAQVPGGLGAPLGDGLLCLGGALVRLATKANAGNAARFPEAGDPTLSARGGVSVGATYTYQVWYRNAAAFCTSATYNLSNGVELTWVP